MSKRVRKFGFQFRLVWKYKGEQRPRYFVSDNPGAVLRMLRRIGTDEPHMGVNASQLKRSWAWLARRLQVSFAAVAHIEPREILIRLRDSFPPLEYIRVEQRQVAAWTEMIDPMNGLKRPTTEKTDIKREMTMATVQGMTREQLDAWRWVPDETAQAVRIRGDHS